MRSHTPLMFLFVSLVTGPWIGCGAQPLLNDEDNAASKFVEQTIPLEPIREHPFNPGAVGKLSEDGGEFRFEGTVDYALGDGYPTIVTQTMGGGRWTGCASKLRGRYEALSVDGSSGAVGAKLDAAGNVIIHLHAEGAASLTVKGEYEVVADGPECGFAPGSRVAVTDVMVVNARRPTQLSVRFTDCHEAPVLRVATNVRVVPEFSLVDAKGDEFQPRNANARHPSTLTVRGDEPLDQVQLTAPHGPGTEGTVSLTTPDAEGLLELSAPFGVPTLIEVVGPEGVTTGVEFGIELKSWAPIESGDEVDMHWADAIQVLTLDELVDGTDLCSGLDDAWSTLESLTPGVCVIEAQTSVAPAAGHRLRDAAVVHASGACTLKLTAPELGGGAGLTSELTVMVNKP